MDLKVLGTALVTAVVLMKLYEALFTAVWEKLKLDNTIKLYVGIAIGSAIGWFAGLNAFPIFEPAAIGQVLTALAIGVGPSFIYDLIDNAQETQALVARLQNAVDTIKLYENGEPLIKLGGGEIDISTP